MKQLMLICLIVLVVPAYAANTKTKHHPAPAAAKPNAIVRQLNKFEEVNIGGNAQVTINIGKISEVAIHTNAAQAECLLTDVNGDMLYIHTLSKPSCQGVVIPVTVTTAKLTGIMTHGTKTTTVNGLHNKALMTYSSGQSRLVLNGDTQSMNAVVSGEAILDAHAFKAVRTLLTASGNTQSKLEPTETLFVNASGQAKVDYLGKPKRLVKSLSDQSTIQQTS